MYHSAAALQTLAGRKPCECQPPAQFQPQLTHVSLGTTSLGFHSSVQLKEKVTVWKSVPILSQDWRFFFWIYMVKLCRTRSVILFLGKIYWFIFPPSDSVLRFSEQRGSRLQSFKKDLFLTFWRNLSFTSIGASCDLTRVPSPFLRFPPRHPR